MKRLLLAAIASTLVFAAASPLQLQAQGGKIKIAIWDFENHAATTWWFHNQMGPAARNHIDTAFSENQKLSEMFSVVEREKLEMVLKEQGLAQTGAVDPQSAAKVGKILGVRYVVTGGIDKFAINTTRGGIGGIGGSRTVADATINLRFIDTTTAERVISISEEGQVSKGGGFIRGASLSRDAEWGIASEAIEATSKKVVAKLVLAQNLDKVSAAAGASAAPMLVAQVDGNRAYINAGASAGLKVGDKVTIFRLGPEIIDPATGAKLGAPEKQVATGVIVEVSPAFSVMTVTGSVAVKDVVKK